MTESQFMLVCCLGVAVTCPICNFGTRQSNFVAWKNNFGVSQKTEFTIIVGNFAMAELCYAIKYFWCVKEN
jgi:hypothetical protein